MFIVLVCTELYYTLYLDILESGLIVQFVSIFLLMAYNSYRNEFHAKSEFIQIDQVKKMNEELTTILVNFPEGIVLYDEAKHEIVLAN